MRKPSVTVVITAFNHAPYIEQALLSVINQAGDEFDLKIMVIDDCSRDSTVTVLKALKKLYDFELIAQVKNRGPSVSRNLGIAKTKTDYISFLDGDDYLLGGKLATQVKAMQARNEVAVCYTDCLIERDNLIEPEPLSKQWSPASGQIYEHLLLRNCIASHAVLMKTSVARKYLFDESLKGPEDYEFWLRLALHGERFLYIGNPLVVYRRISASLSAPSQPIFDEVLKVLNIYEPHINTDEQRLNINHHRSVILQNKADLYLQHFDRRGTRLLTEASQLETIPRYKTFSLSLMRRFFWLGALAYKVLDLRSRLRAQREQVALAKDKSRDWLIVGVDIRGLQSPHRFRGIGHFLNHAIQALARQDHKNLYVLYCLENQVLELPVLDSSFKFFVKPVATPPVGLDWLVASYHAGRRMEWAKGIDAFLQSDLAGGLAHGPTKNIVVVHDFIPVIFKHFQMPAWRFGLSASVLKYNRRVLGASLILKRQLHMYKKAWRLLAISESTRRDALKYLPGVKTDKVSVIHLAAELPDKNTSTVAVPGVSKKFIFYIGSIEYRKNVSSLISAFNEIRQRGEDVQLVLAGNDFKLPDALSDDANRLRQQITASPYSKDIIVPGYVSEGQRNWLYKNAEVFVFPSLYEGFGLPILEAMAAGCPVIALNNSSIPEVAGEAAILLDTASEVPGAVIMLLNDSSIAKKLRRRGLAQAKRFSWDNTGKEISEVINEARYESRH